MSALQQLLDNQISSIVVDDFLSTTQIATFLQALESHAEWKEVDLPKSQEHLFEQPPKHLFHSQYLIITHGTTEDAYLATCKQYQTIWQDITTRCGFDPFQLFVDYIKQHFAIEIKLAAKKEATYCPIVVRDLAMKILPHADFGPFDGENWVIDQVVKQIAWNIYLTDPQTGGETIVYDHVWNNKAELDDNSYGIEHMNKPIKTQFSVKPGKLVLFNCQNFHSVAQSSAPRIAIGGLVGETRKGEMIAWS